MLTLRKVVDHHDKISEAMATCQSTRRASTKMTQEVLSHIETQFQCIDLRLKGLEKRMQNMIALVCIYKSYFINTNHSDE